MAGRAHFDAEIATRCRTRFERVAAAACHGDLLVLRMNIRLHSGGPGFVKWIGILGLYQAECKCRWCFFYQLALESRKLQEMTSSSVWG